MHDVHALLSVVQEDAGQPEHGPVMLLEQPFDLSFPVCHTLYIHTKADLLNPFPHFFNHETKLPIKTDTHNPQMGAFGFI